jgi:hypothetical protein
MVFSFDLSVPFDQRTHGPGRSRQAGSILSQEILSMWPGHSRHFIDTLVGID